MSFELDNERLLAIYRGQAETMLVYMTRRCYDAQLALDLVAETFARAHAKRSAFRGADEQAASAWVWAIAKNALRDALAKGRAERRALALVGVRTPRLSEEEIARVEELASIGELRATIAHALAELGEEQREAVRLRVVQELDYETIAERLGISPQTARARVSRGLRALAVALDASEARIGEAAS